MNKSQIITAFNRVVRAQKILADELKELKTLLTESPKLSEHPVKADSEI